MPQNEAAGIDPLAGGTFSRLLFSDTELDADTLMGFNHHDITSFTFSSDQKPPKMLCFGPDCINGNINGGSTTTTTDDKSSTNSTTTSLSSNSNMKRNMESDYYQPVNVSTSFTTTEATVAPSRTTRRNNKKMKTENTPPASHAKVKKEKLGERIAALQQMVSPYGKTDTASVLHEAMGYIKFLQEQVQVLCSPYLKRLPTTDIGDGDGDGERKKDLRSQGLCLVPVDCTHHVAESNGADLWSPAMVNRQGGSSALH